MSDVVGSLIAAARRSPRAWSLTFAARAAAQTRSLLVARARDAEFLPRYDFHLVRRRRSPSDDDPRFSWDTHFGGDFDFVDYVAGRATFVADYEAVLGSEFRPFDPNQGNYTLEAFVVGARRASTEVAGVFHHVSRHLSDRPKRVRDRLERARRARACAGSTSAGDASTLDVDGGRVVQHSLRRLHVDRRLRRLLVRHPIIAARRRLRARASASVFGVDGASPDRGTQTGGRVEARRAAQRTRRRDRAVRRRRTARRRRSARPSCRSVGPRRLPAASADNRRIIGRWVSPRDCRCRRAAADRACRSVSPSPPSLPRRRVRRKLQYQITTLPNGLTVVLSEDHSTPIVHVQLWYHVGSKNEKPGRTGFAHLFEHLMFKGSKNVEPEAHTSMIASVGGQSNAYTTDDETVFWETVPAQYLPLALWLEADRMATLRIDKDTFANEREVVKEERRMRIDNQPYGRLQRDHLRPGVHRRIPTSTRRSAAWRISRRRRSTTCATSIDTYYVPENATLVLVGDFDSAQALQLVDAVPRPRAEGRRGRCRATSRRSRRRRKEKRVTLQEPWPLPAVVVAYHITYDGNPDSYPLHIAVEGAVRRPELADLQEAGLREADGGRRVRQREPHRGSESVLRGGDRAARAHAGGGGRRADRRVRSAEGRADQRARAAAHQEPVRARLHPRPRVGPAEGAAAGARRR